MKFKYFVTLSLIFVLQPFTLLYSQTGHSVGITVNGGAETKIRLAYHLGNEQYIKDSLSTDKAGKGRFTGSEKLSPGVYMVVLPGNTFFEFLAGEDQYFDISCSIDDPAGTLVFRGSDENDRFLEYQKKWKSLQEEAMAASQKLKAASPSGSENAALKQQLSDQEKKMKQYLHETADKNKGTLLGAIAMSIIPVETIVPNVPAGMANPDSVSRLWSYLYYKDHFFDNIDFSQPGLIRSPVLGGKLDQFFRQVVIQMPDSINKEADRVLDMSGRNKDMFQYVAVWLLNRYATSEIMGHDAVVVHLADSVYLAGKAPWANEEYLSDLAKRVERLRPNLIGKKAAEMVMSSFAGQLCLTL